MKVEVGKVYKCGDGYVYIDSKSKKLESWGLFPYIGICCNLNGEEVNNTYVGRFCSDGEDSSDNISTLKYWLEEIPARETITIGSSVYYKDEFEEATKHLKEVK